MFGNAELRGDWESCIARRIEGELTAGSLVNAAQSPVSEIGAALYHARAEHAHRYAAASRRRAVFWLKP